MGFPVRDSCPRARGAWVAAWLAATGCGGEFALDPEESDEPAPLEVAVSESFVQEPLPRVDLLLVIDDTASMAQEQAALAARFSSLLGDLDTLGVSWQLGVVTTDMAGSSAGWLRGSPYVLTPAVEDREARFAEMVQVGTEGGTEAGLAAAATALDLAGPGGPNAGFRRPDALLHVVFVSDADDQSEDWLGDDPPGAFLDVLTAESAITGLPARASGLVGPLPTGCSSGTGMAQAAVAYAAVAESSGGVIVSICAADLDPVLQTLSEVAVVWPTDFVLREAPLADSVRVSVDGVGTDDFTVLPDVPAVHLGAAPPPESRVDVAYLVRLSP